MADRGASPIVGIGFSQGTAIEKAAKEFPKLQFAIIDFVVDLPNVQSVVFKEHEGSFLVGMMAAMASKTGTTRDLGELNAKLDRLEALMSSKSGAAPRKRKGARQGNGVVPASDEVLKTIKQSKQGLKFADIQAKTGFPDKKIRNIIFRLNKLSKIKRHSRGVYMFGALPSVDQIKLVIEGRKVFDYKRSPALSPLLVLPGARSIASLVGLDQVEEIR